ncbi:CRE_collapsed_G0013820.mRNA.1.CDS.1 [Saccharomyces cerevisiae]|nr:CRE_collapsed_G0013820.mRNA.1.CDS.1 [Saccharomyces cerevisiae]
MFKTSLPILETKKENIEGTISKIERNLNTNCKKEFEKWKKTIRFKSLKTKPYIKSIAVLSLAKKYK